MPLTPSDILPSRSVPEVATGPVISTGTNTATVRVRPGLHVTVPTIEGQAPSVGQMVSVAMPGGQLSAAQIIGPAAGSVAAVRQVVV